MARVRIFPHAIDGVLNGLDSGVAKDLLRRAIQVEGAAKRLCPVDTGRLRSSISHELDHEGGQLVAYVGSNVHYAIYQELGTRHMRAQPFLRPALRAAR